MEIFLNIELLNFLKCPKTGQDLILEENSGKSKEILEGWLVSSDKRNRYPIYKGIPRFVDQSNYADNFGMQWNYFSKTQLDSYSGANISSKRFWLATGWTPAELKGKWVLDVGCGSGRFAEVALKAGANVIAIDYSSAVDACRNNLKRYRRRLHVVQADIYSLPFLHESFSYVYSLGVLQHTPDVKKSFFMLTKIVKRKGKLCVDYYWKRFRTLFHIKYLLRPLTKRISQDTLFIFLQNWTPKLLILSRSLGRIPFFGKILKRAVPVADYYGIYPLSNEQLEEWALLDTFDMFAPKYDNPQRLETVKEWFYDASFIDITVGHWGHLVARGTKS